MSLLEKLQELVESEVKKELMRYAQVISKKHDISLKLLLQDIHTKEDGVSKTTGGGQCLGVTAKKTQCTFSGKNGGYCTKHISQKKAVKVVDTVVETEKNLHIGHTMKECMFLAGCPACEKTKQRTQNLLIDI
jgi:hypothetical protein